MNDIFEAAQHGWRMYMHAKRATGRTEKLLELMATGDTVVVVREVEGKRLQNMARKKGKDIEYLASPTNVDMHTNLFKDLRSSALKGKIHFEHTWIECYIADHLYGITHSFDELTQRLEELRKKQEALTSLNAQIQTENYAHDPRPNNCRSRLKEEGKAYPKGGCTVCNVSIITGLRCPYL